MTARLIRTTVTVEFRPPDTMSGVPLETYRQMVANDMHTWIRTSLPGCQVLSLGITAQHVPE